MDDTQYVPLDMKEPPIAPEEQALQERDDRVATRLKKLLDESRREASQLRQAAASYDKRAERIMQAVESEQWWQLQGLIPAADIESLCECSPSELLGSDDFVMIDGERFDRY